jgi:hypothetical protein
MAMDLDDLKRAWTAHGALLERSVAINERLLRETMLRKARVAMAPFVAWRVLEVVLGVVALGLFAPVLAAHVDEPRYLVVAGALVAGTVAITAVYAHLLVASLRLDHGGPVVAIQRDVEHIALGEYRATKWALLGGVLLWLPAALVGYEAITGVDALARADLAWLVANLAFGIAVLVVGHLASRRYVERPDLGPRARRVADALSGRSLRAVASHLAEIERFGRAE